MSFPFSWKKKKIKYVFLINKLMMKKRWKWWTKNIYKYITCNNNNTNYFYLGCWKQDHFWHQELDHVHLGRVQGGLPPVQQFSLEHNRHHCSQGKRIFIAILPYINLCFLHVYNYICGCPSITDLFLHNLPSFIIRLVKSEVFFGQYPQNSEFFFLLRLQLTHKLTMHISGN